MMFLSGCKGESRSSSTVASDGNYLQKNNYEFSLRLAEYALQNDHRFIYASSAATYGVADNFSDRHERLEELHPLNLYGYNKHMVDLWFLQQGAIDEVVGLKYFNVFGPNEYHKGRMGSMVMHMTKHILNEGVVRLFKSTSERYKDGEQCRDFIYVKQAAEMTCSFLESDCTGIFNVGSGQATSWNDLAKAAFKALQKKEHIEYFDMPQDLKEHYLSYTCADMSKYLALVEEGALTKVRQYSIEEAVAEYIQNYLIGYKRW